MDEFIIFLIGLIYLAYFMIEDLEDCKVENKPIIAFFCLGLVILLFSKDMWLIWLLCVFMATISLGMWHYQIIGGADVKILASLVPFLLVGIPNAIAGFWIFLLMFGLMGGVYGLISTKIIKKKYIPFVPIIFMTYVCFWIVRFIAY